MTDNTGQERVDRLFIWPCDHGDVLVERNIPPHYVCAECGSKPMGPYYEAQDYEREKKRCEEALEAWRRQGAKATEQETRTRQVKARAESVDASLQEAREVIARAREYVESGTRGGSFAINPGHLLALLPPDEGDCSCRAKPCGKPGCEFEHGDPNCTVHGEGRKPCRHCSGTGEVLARGGGKVPCSLCHGSVSSEQHGERVRLCRRGQERTWNESNRPTAELQAMGFEVREFEPVPESEGGARG